MFRSGTLQSTGWRRRSYHARSSSFGSTTLNAFWPPSQFGTVSVYPEQPSFNFGRSRFVGSLGSLLSWAISTVVFLCCILRQVSSHNLALPLESIQCLRPNHRMRRFLTNLTMSVFPIISCLKFILILGNSLLAEVQKLFLIFSCQVFSNSVHPFG